MSTSLAQLTAVITLILECPGGLNILTGKLEPPTAEELYQIVESCKRPVEALGMKIDKGGSSPLAETVTLLADTFEGIVERFGGWVHIIETTKQWAMMNVPSWRLVIDYHCWVKGYRSRIDGSMVDKISERHGVTPPTLYRLVRRFPGELANSIMRTPIEHREAV